MTLQIEGVVDRSVRGEEALSEGDGFEPLHLALSSPDREERVFGAVVFAQATRPMTIFHAEHVQCRAAGLQAIGDEALWAAALVAKQALQQFQRCGGITTLRNNEIKDLAFVVDRPSQIDALTADVGDHLVEMPPCRGRLSATPELGGDLRPELDRPVSDGLVADANSPWGQ